MNHLRKFGAGLALILPLTLGCGKNSPQLSQTKVTDIQNSEVKRQSIGNCWIYATASWVESLNLAATGNEINVSESYWTWWHWYNQLINSSETQLSTGGTFNTAANIIRNHGLVMEGEFLPSEANDEMSWAQDEAESLVNQEMQQGGRLEKPQQRTPEMVRQVLDEGFGSNMAQAETIARAANQMEGGKDRNGNRMTLLQAVNGNNNQRWNVVSYARVYGQNAQVSSQTLSARKQLLTRVMKALNDYHPVVLSLMVDFNAMSTTDGTFSVETLNAAGGTGRQGGHMMVLEDYVVDNVPGVGTIGEGDTTAAVKQQALQGDVRYLKTKNSWGKNRPERGLTDGYTRFMMTYLDATLGWHADEDDPNSEVSYYTTLTDFVLPPGY